MDPLDQLLCYYPAAPWLALLRAIEVRRIQALGDVCARPVLDLGCGDGFVSSLAFGSGICAGLDVDWPALVRAAARGVFHALVRGDARHLPFASGTFRTVYSNGAMEHMDDLTAVLREIARVLTPRGVLATCVPSDRFRTPVGWLAELLGTRIWEAFNRLHHHVNLLSREEWEGRLEAAGFGVTRVEAYGGLKIAASIAGRDLWSKMRIAARRPFLTLAHGGNLGRISPGCSSGALQRAFAREQLPDEDGYWLMILAEKRPQL